MKNIFEILKATDRLPKSMAHRRTGLSCGHEPVQAGRVSMLFEICDVFISIFRHFSGAANITKIVGLFQLQLWSLKTIFENIRFLRLLHHFFICVVNHHRRSANEVFNTVRFNVLTLPNLTFFLIARRKNNRTEPNLT